MKKLFLLIALAAIVASCEDENNFRIKSTDMISIRPAAGTYNAQKIKSEVTHLTAMEIVKQTVLISTPNFQRSFASEQRDTVSSTPKLLMWATDVITLDGQLQTDWITSTDVVFVRYINGSYLNRDTIAYIPNATQRVAETAIRAAYGAKDIDSCYTAFNTAYTFIPITGEEWRALRAEGKN